MNCVACGIETCWREKFNRLNTNFIECENCGLIRMENIPSPNLISAHYAQKAENGNYKLLQEYEVEYQAIYRRFLNFTINFAGIPQGKRLIDIGCFTGRFLDIAKNAGFSTYGVEYQPQAAKIANEQHNGRVYCGPIENYSKQSSDLFDVITLFGTIEHVTAPDDTLRISTNLLKPGGIYIIQTPNTSSLLARIMGKKWPVFTPIEHIYYFSSQNIKIFLSHYGLKVIKISRHWKYLPVGYVYKQFENFGPEYFEFLNKLMPFLPKNFLKWKFPFYGGEMLIAAEKI